VVVLGAQVRKSGPSLVLRYRLDKAIEYLDENPNTICIVSGGKGPNEPFPEAQGMADYLKEHGIDEQRILEEPDSKTTEENIVNSKKLISDDNASVGVITNNFHMFRALQIAHKYGGRLSPEHARQQYGSRVFRRNQIPAVTFRQSFCSG